MPDEPTICQRWSFNQLQNQRPRVARLLQAVDRADVGMIERRQHLRFALESGQTFGVAGKGVWEHLDRHLPVKARVSGSIDLAHAAFADLGGDFIDAEASAGLEGHTILAGATEWLILQREPHLRLAELTRRCTQGHPLTHRSP